MDNTTTPDTPRGTLLKLEVATVDDVPELTRLWYNAFSIPTMLAIWPDTPGVRQWWDEATLHDLRHRPCEQYLKVVDPQTGRIAAFARWSLQTVEARGPRWPAWHPDQDPAAADAFLQTLEENRARFVGGRENFYLDMLATHTDFRRMGAARLLLQWGCEEADRAKVPVYIDASDEGRPVYERFGFVAQDVKDGVASMVREPGTKA
ncbi:acyl-CoA N-acyltransferase [Aspergillus ellipticus CBS 707.79]|uniref:Acyl-CoA N-acyltransferase n=1 Tax=Aspergillus ellipticus CBS 707.79 TaxID=1448320 RepID=A0A319CYC3_9EURO|nr:acyl-CoA N-acyltransferase [Aspergillus ellipticus CBS 707.79]